MSCFKKCLSFMLALIMCVSMLPVIETQAVTKAEAQETGVYQRILEIEEELRKTFPNGVFSVNGTDCYTSYGHECSNCSLYNIVEKKFGESRTNWGKVSGEGYQCNAFARFVMVRIFGSVKDTTDKLDIGSASSANTYKALKTGDLFYTSKHCMIYLWHDSTGVTVLDANGFGDLKIGYEYKYPYGHGNLSGSVSVWHSPHWDEINDKYSHKHTWDNVGKCTDTECGKYYENVVGVTAKNGTVYSDKTLYIKAHPYTGTSGVNQDEMPSGSYNVVGEITNHYGNLWYKVKYTVGGTEKTGFVYSGDVTFEAVPNNINIELRMDKTSVVQGSSVWANSPSETYNWYGKVSSSDGVTKLKTVKFGIYKPDGTLTASGNEITKSPNAVSYVVGRSDDTMQFSKLPVGSYILKITATDMGNKTATQELGFSIISSGTTTYTVTFNANGGSCSTTSKTVVKGGTLSSLPTPTRTGYNFLGWFTASTGGTKITTSTTFSANTTVYAQWEEIPVVYTVTFDTNGGTCSISSKTTNGDGTLSSLPTPTRTGYTFLGWYLEGNTGDFGTSANGETKITTSTKFTADTTVHAHWKEISSTYTVTFVAQNSALAPKTMEISAGGKINGPDAIMLFHPMYTYIFVNAYYKDSALTDVWDFDNDAVNESITLYADYDIGRKITYDVNGGDITSCIDQAVVRDGTLFDDDLLPTPTRGDSMFLGWYTAPVGGEKVEKGTEIRGDMTLYAQWEMVQTSIDVDVQISAGSSADVIVPEGGWQKGKNAFTVGCEAACYVAVSYDGGKTYTRLAANPADNGYSFTVDGVDTGTIIAVGNIGDVNGDGSLTIADVSKLKAIFAGKATASGGLQRLACDFNNDGNITIADISGLKAAFAGKKALNW